MPYRLGLAAKTLVRSRIPALDAGAHSPYGLEVFAASDLLVLLYQPADLQLPGFDRDVADTEMPTDGIVPYGSFVSFSTGHCHIAPLEIPVDALSIVGFLNDLLPCAPYDT